VTDDLYERLRRQCCSISGLTPAELDQHARQIEQVVRKARRRGTDVEAVTYLGHSLVLSNNEVTVYTPNGKPDRTFTSMSSARRHLRGQRTRETTRA